LQAVSSEGLFVSLSLAWETNMRMGFSAHDQDFPQNAARQVVDWECRRRGLIPIHVLFDDDEEVTFSHIFREMDGFRRGG
jgi:hypothetical protein